MQLPNRAQSSAPMHVCCIGMTAVLLYGTRKRIKDGEVTQEDTCQKVLLCYCLLMGSTTLLQMCSHWTSRGLASATMLDELAITGSGNNDPPACLTWSQRRRGLRYAQHGLPWATHSGGVLTHQQGAATLSESTCQPRQSKFHKLVTKSSRRDYGSRTGHLGRTLGPEIHDQGPVPNLDRGTDVKLVHTTAAGGGGGAMT